MGVTDCHVHINPLWEMRPEARALVGEITSEVRFERFLDHPAEFLEYLDRSGVDRAVLVNYVSRDVIGYTERTNEFVAQYVREDPERLIAVGSVLPTHPTPREEVRRLVTDLGIRALKIHPPHQLFPPNGYLDGHLVGLREIYAECERLEVPVVFHTGTSVFPGARNRYGEPILVEDVAIDFPRLTIVLAHGGRPLWMNEATFLTRRFPNVYLEVSGIPPDRILSYFPDLERISERVLFGTDWPGPGVRGIGQNLDAFRRLGLSESTQERVLVQNPERVFPRRSGA